MYDPFNACIIVNYKFTYIRYAITLCWDKRFRRETKDFSIADVTTSLNALHYLKS